MADARNPNEMNPEKVSQILDDINADIQLTGYHNSEKLRELLKASSPSYAIIVANPVLQDQYKDVYLKCADRIFKETITKIKEKNFKEAAKLLNEFNKLAAPMGETLLKSGITNQMQNIAIELAAAKLDEFTSSEFGEYQQAGIELTAAIQNLSWKNSPHQDIYQEALNPLRNAMLQSLKNNINWLGQQNNSPLLKEKMKIQLELVKNVLRSAGWILQNFELSKLILKEQLRFGLNEINKDDLLKAIINQDNVDLAMKVGPHGETLLQQALTTRNNELVSYILLKNANGNRVDLTQDPLVEEELQKIKLVNNKLKAFKKWLKEINKDLGNHSNPQELYNLIQQKAHSELGHELSIIPQQAPNYMVISARNALIQEQVKNNRLISQVTHPLFKQDSTITFKPITASHLDHPGAPEQSVSVTEFKNIIKLPAGEFGLVYQAEYTGSNEAFQQLCAARPDPINPKETHYWFVIKNPTKATDKDFTHEVMAVTDLKKSWKDSDPSNEKESYYNLAQSAKFTAGDQQLNVIISPLESYNVVKDPTTNKTNPQTANAEHFFKVLSNLSDAKTPEEKALAEQFNQKGTINTLAILGQIYTGMNNIHSAGWLHLDLALRNIFMSDTTFEEIRPGVKVPINYSVKVADPGKAKKLENGFAIETSSRPPYTSSNQTRLKASQIPLPKGQIISVTSVPKEKLLSVASDLYSFRSILTGELAYMGGISREVSLNIRSDTSFSAGVDVAVYTRDHGDKMAMEKFVDNLETLYSEKSTPNVDTLSNLLNNFSSYIKNPAGELQNPNDSAEKNIEKMNKIIANDKNEFINAYKNTFFECLEKEFLDWKGNENIESMQNFLIAVKKLAAMPIMKENATSPAEKALIEQCQKLASYELLDSKVHAKKSEILTEIHQFKGLLNNLKVEIGKQHKILPHQLDGFSVAGVNHLIQAKKMLAELENTYLQSKMLALELIEKQKKGETLSDQEINNPNLKDIAYFKNEMNKIHKLLSAAGRDLTEHRRSVISNLRNDLDNIMQNHFKTDAYILKKINVFKHGQVEIEIDNFETAHKQYNAITSTTSNWKFSKASYANVLHLINTMQESVLKLGNKLPEKFKTIMESLKEDKKTLEILGRKSKYKEIWETFQTMDLSPESEVFAETGSLPVINKETPAVLFVNVISDPLLANPKALQTNLKQYQKELAKAKNEMSPEDYRAFMGQTKDKLLATSLLLETVQSAFNANQSKNGGSTDVKTIFALALLNGATISQSKENAEKLLRTAKKYQKFNRELQAEIFTFDPATRPRARNIVKEKVGRKPSPSDITTELHSKLQSLTNEIETNHNVSISGPNNLFQLVANDADRHAILKNKELNAAYANAYAKSVTLTADTLIAADKEFFENLDTDEIYRTGGVKEPRSTSNTWTNYFNQLAVSIRENILSKENLAERTMAYEYWINVMDQCLSNPNVKSLSAAMSIRSALDNSAVMRLHQTKAGVSPQALAIYEKNSAILETASNFKSIREFYKTHPNTIPYLGMYFTDITFVEDGNKLMMSATENKDLTRTPENQLLLDSVTGVRTLSLAYNQHQILRNTRNHIAEIDYKPGTDKKLKDDIQKTNSSEMKVNELYTQSLKLEARLAEGEDPKPASKAAIEISKPLYVTMKADKRKQKPLTATTEKKKAPAPLIILNENNNFFAAYLKEFETCDIGIIQSTNNDNYNKDLIKFKITSEDKQEEIDRVLADKKAYFDENKPELYTLFQYGKTYTAEELKHTGVNSKIEDPAIMEKALRNVSADIRNQILAQHLINQRNEKNPTNPITLKDSLVLDDYARLLFLNQRHHLSREKELVDEPPIRKVMAAIYLMNADNGSFFKENPNATDQQNEVRRIKNRRKFAKQFIYELVEKDLEGFKKFLNFLESHPEIVKNIPEKIKTYIEKMKKGSAHRLETYKDQQINSLIRKNARHQFELTDTSAMDRLIAKDPLYFLKGHYQFNNNQSRHAPHAAMIHYFNNRKKKKLITAKVYTHLNEMLDQARTNHSLQTIEYILANRELRDLYRKEHHGLASLRTIYQATLEDVSTALSNYSANLSPAEAALAQRNLADKVTHDILSETSLKHRALVLERWVSLLEKAYVKNDFTTVMAIYQGLNNPAVAHLTHTFDSLSSGAKFIMKQMDEWLKHNNSISDLKTNHLQTVFAERRERDNAPEEAPPSPFFSRTELLSKERMPLPKPIYEKSKPFKLFHRNETMSFTTEDKKVLKTELEPPREKTIDEYLEDIQNILNELIDTRFLSQPRADIEKPESKEEGVLYNGRKHTLFTPLATLEETEEPKPELPPKLETK